MVSNINKSTSELEGLAESEIFHLNQMVIPNVGGMTLSDRLLTKRHQVVKVQEDLAQQIKRSGSSPSNKCIKTTARSHCGRHLGEFELMQRDFEQRGKKLKGKEERMQHRMKTNILLQRSEEQRCIAEKKSRCTRELIEKNQEHLQELNKELETLIIQRQQLKEQVQENCIYAEYFDEVLKESKNFDEVYDLITHYHTRKKVRQEVSTIVEGKKEELEKSHAKIDWVMKEHSTAQMTSKMKINKLKKELDSLEQDVLDWEEAWNEVQRLAQTKDDLQSQISWGVFQISKHMWKKGTKNLNLFTLQEVLELLDEIQDFISDLQIILEKVDKI